MRSVTDPAATTTGITDVNIIMETSTDVILRVHTAQEDKF